MPLVEELKGDPLYCIACAKQFSSKGVYDGHLLGKKHKEAAAAFVAGGGDAAGVARHRRVFVLQQIISALAKHLKPIIDATKNFTQKKLTLTYEELQQVALLNVPVVPFFVEYVECACPVSCDPFTSGATAGGGTRRL